VLVHFIAWLVGGLGKGCPRPGAFVTNEGPRPRVRNGAKGWVRTSDLRVMSPASYRLLHSRMKGGGNGRIRIVTDGL
jgi:hypothetical protein